MLPTYAGGLVVRFAATRQDLAGSDTDALHTATGPWTPPRMLYLQHSSDPLVWWDPALVISRPDWLSETPGSDRSPAMRWHPFVTFGQVTRRPRRGAGCVAGTRTQLHRPDALRLGRGRNAAGMERNRHRAYRSRCGGVTTEALRTPRAGHHTPEQSLGRETDRTFSV
ncbi:hypothetical protein YT1_0257 [Rhodococcus ruber]|nr:hypothetical protein YT1_0257 [Rhodococcus ruber]